MAHAAGRLPRHCPSFLARPPTRSPFLDRCRWLCCCSQSTSQTQVAIANKEVASVGPTTKLGRPPAVRYGSLRESKANYVNTFLGADAALDADGFVALLRA